MFSLPDLPQHRYWGDDAKPLGVAASLTNEGLQYLSLQQTLADFAAVLDHARQARAAPACAAAQAGTSTGRRRAAAQTHSLHRLLSHSLAALQKLSVPKTAATVCYGGGYAGHLTALMRLNYPKQCHAALASSATVSERRALPCGGRAGQRGLRTRRPIVDEPDLLSRQLAPSAGQVHDAGGALPADQVWRRCGERAAAPASSQRSSRRRGAMHAGRPPARQPAALPYLPPRRSFRRPSGRRAAGRATSKSSWAWTR